MITHYVLIAMTTLFSFDNSLEIKEWRTIDDIVMGGRSSSDLLFKEGGFMCFSGSVSLENNGGFASCRTIPKDFQLNDYEGIIIRVRGDGRKYSFRIRTDNNWDGVSFVHEFNTNAAEWQEIKMAFKNFRPQYRGNQLKGCYPLDPSLIKQLGFMISSGQAGEFALDIDWIAAYR